MFGSSPKTLFIQWGFSQVFPSKTLCAHVTTWNKKTSVKFRTDVAMMCKLGFDIKMDDLTNDEQTYCRHLFVFLPRTPPTQMAAIVL